MNNCTIIKCKEKKAEGEWIDFCVHNHIHEIQLPESEVARALKIFQTEGR